MNRDWDMKWKDKTRQYLKIKSGRLLNFYESDSYEVDDTFFENPKTELSND